MTSDDRMMDTEHNPLFEKMSERFLFDGHRTLADMMKKKAERVAAGHEAGKTIVRK